MECLLEASYSHRLAPTSSISKYVHDDEGSYMHRSTIKMGEGLENPFVSHEVAKGLLPTGHHHVDQYQPLGFDGFLRYFWKNAAIAALP